MYRDVKGLMSFLLDDDNGDHYASLAMGYAMDQDRPFKGLGVDYLYDTTGLPDVSKGLTLYFRADQTKSVDKYGPGWRPFWWFSAGVSWPCESSEITDILRDPYGMCKTRWVLSQTNYFLCFGSSLLLRIGGNDVVDTTHSLLIIADSNLLLKFILTGS